MKRAVVLLSGGVDSATACAVAKQQGFAVHALTIDYGQRHAIELQSARKVAESIGVAEHRILTMNLAPFAKSALTGGEAVPKDRALDEDDIPVTYVPARNLIFLSCAAAWAESLGARDIFIGVSSVDYSGYPDCRGEFLASFEHTVNLATKAGVEGSTITVHAPFLDITKTAVVRLGRDLGVDYSLTHSCYDPDPQGKPCDRCDSCVIRRNAFEEADRQ